MPLQQDIAVLLVINVQGQTEPDKDYEENSISTEFFTEMEAQDLIDGVERLGIYREVINGEKEFVEKLTSGYITGLPFKQKIVYSSTGIGLGRSKSALMPALCDLYGLIYCSNDTYTAALLENKVHLMDLLKMHGFPLPAYWVYDPKQGWLNGKTPDTSIKLIAKPAYECASISIDKNSVGYYSDRYEKMVQERAKKYKQPIIVEAFIKGYEVEVPVFDLEDPLCPLAVGIKKGENTKLGDDFLTYEMVKLDEYEFYNFDKENRELAEELKRIASDSFKLLNLSGIVRVDFRIAEDGTPYIMDYNNSPHLPKQHSCSFSIIELGFEYETLLALLIWKALKP